MIRIINGVRESKGKQASDPHLEKKGSGRLDLNQLVENWAVKPNSSNFIYPYMRANPVINSSNFSVLLAESTKCATTTLLSTTFRQPGVLVGFSDCSHKLGNLAPCRTNFGADNSSVGITTTCYSDHMSPEETGQF